MFEKGEIWFETKLEQDDIESAFTSPLKIYKSGKYYLLRVNVLPNIKIYSETDELLTFEDVTTDKTLISILEIQGIKFTTRNFQIEFLLRQTMVVNPDPFLEQCFIRKPSKPVVEPISHITNTTNSHSIDAETDHSNEQVFEEEKEKEKDNPVTDNKSVDIPTDEFYLEESSHADDPDATPELSPKSRDATQFSDDLGIEEVNPSDPIEPANEELELALTEVNPVDMLEDSPSIQLTNRNQIYYEIYKKAREKAIRLKQEAIKAFLDAKNIKNTYMLDNTDISDDEEMEMDGEKYNSSKLFNLSSN
jgi:hypothetical protein